MLHIGRHESWRWQKWLTAGHESCTCLQYSSHMGMHPGHVRNDPQEGMNPGDVSNSWQSGLNPGDASFVSHVGLNLEGASNV